MSYEKFTFRNLDEVTRKLMIEEITLARETNQIYDSKSFNAEGKKAWPDLLIRAAQSEDEHWLAYQLETMGLLTEGTPARIPSGGYTIRHVSSDAEVRLADGQFNRFYMIAVARRAFDSGKYSVTIYRAKERSEERGESQGLVGDSKDCKDLITELRDKVSSLKSTLTRPNSGLSVYFE